MKKYKIKKGNHYSGIHFGISTENNFKYNVIFDKSCLYRIDTIDKYDINKLCGVSTSYFHHEFSARFGWRCINDKIEIVTYCYDNGKRLTEQVLGIVDVNEPILCELSLHDRCYDFICKTKNKTVTRTVFTSKKPSMFKYNLYPYFGGNNTAPHDMYITIS